MDISTLSFDHVSLLSAIESVNLANAKRRRCDEYAHLFWKQHNSAPELADASQFLGFVCGWRLRCDETHSPFETVFGDEVQSTSHWGAITDEHAYAIEKIAREITDDELRARLCDFVWIRLRAHEYARVAAAAYISSAEELIRADCVSDVKERLSRGMTLASMLGPPKLRDEIIGRVRTIASREDLENCVLEDCLVALKESRHEVPQLLYDLAIRRVRSISATDPNPLWERRFWELAATFALQDKNNDRHCDAIMEVARTFEREAERATKSFVSSFNWEQALHTYRRIPGTEQDRDRVHRRLVEAQRGLPSEMFSCPSGSVDISELVFAAQGRIRGKDKTRALAELIVASHWQSKSMIREGAEDIIRSYPLQHMFSTVQLSSTWKVAATASAGTPMESEIPQDRLNAAMCQQYKMFFPFAATGTIEPMRNELLMAHCVSLGDIAELVNASPYVPRGREVLFTIGIHAGLQGRFIESLHVLIPQLENMLRCWLFDSNLISSTINQDGIQREMNLNQILELPATESLFSEDLCFVLRALFTEQFGHNLRNEMAHGMLSPGSCFSGAAIYAWWLIFHMVARPIAIAIIQRDDDSTGETTQHDSNTSTANSTEPSSPPTAGPPI